MARLTNSNGINWQILPLQHLYKGDYVLSDMQRRLSNRLVEQWRKENPSATLEEQMVFASVLIIYMQLLSAANRHQLLNGTRGRTDMELDSAGMTREEFDSLKREEMKLVPALHKQLMDALGRTGRTGKDKRMSEDIRTSAEAAQAVYQRMQGEHGDPVQTY